VAAAARLAVAAIAAAGAPPAAAAGINDAARTRLARQIDGAVGSAPHERRHGIVAVRLAGLPAVLVTRDATIADVRTAVPSAVRRPAPGVWELDRLLVLTRGATLTIAEPQVRELRLVSRGARFATLVARHGSLRFAGLRGHDLVVRSWDAATGAPDTELEDGRPSVSVRGAGRLDASDTSFEDLGFSEGRVSGVAATSPRLPPLPAPPPASPAQAMAAIAATDPPDARRPTGALVRSRFIRNVFGAYSYEARDMRWIDDEFRDNVIYGLDPHDNSDGFLVEGNIATGNGRHGIIFSRFCDFNVIRGNRTFGNGWHGIVIDDGNRADGPSDHNVVADNDVRGNAKVGVSIDGSSRNLVAGNRIDGQRYGVRVFRRSFANVVRHNRITRSGDYGVFVDGATGTRILSNVVTGVPTGARLRDAARSVVSANGLLGMRSHGVQVDGVRSAANVISGNRITGAGTSPILAAGGGDPLQRDNRERWNYPLLHDVARAMSWFVGPGLWVLLLLAVVLGPLPGRARRARRAWR
jgi:parallel beta-helix repeat protein